MTSCVCTVDECVLCEAHLFQDLKPEQACDVRGLLHQRIYKPGERLLHEGSDCNNLYMLRHGYVKLSTSLPDGREQIVRIAVAGHLLGFESLETHVSPYTATAVTEVNVCRIRYADMLGILKDAPEVSMRVIHRLSDQLDQSLRLIRDLGLKNSTERVASFIASLTPLNGNLVPELLMPLSRREIAEMLGLTVETVSRLMAKLRRDGIIEEHQGHMRVRDTARLMQLTGANPH